MAKTSTAAPAEQTEFPLSLEEFCTRLSVTDKRVELIAAFNHTEASAGRTKDNESAYQTRYLAFATAPA